MKKCLLRYLNYIIPIFIGVNTLYAQKTTVPVSSYGVWDRGGSIQDYSDPLVDYVMGIETSEKWEEIQKNGPGKYDFSTFQDALNKAYKYNKKVKISVNVGPYSPFWIYEHGVPLVAVTSNKPKKHAKFQNYPYYLNEAYKEYYFQLIEQFALFLRNQPEEIFNCIGFVQVKTGATGDEAPYKGEPNNKKFKITRKQWEDFRLEAFAQFKKCFNDVENHQIVLTFNSIDPQKNPEAYHWVMNTIDPAIGFGIKGGAYNRGHHLTGEQTFKEQWVPYLVNPKGIQLFSASEMDQSWQKPIFSINNELGFYWAALGAINTGLSSYNITTSAIEYAHEHKEIREIFKLYNKYARQIYPETATATISIFHEGLNAADIVKYPESIYGQADRNNPERYINICKAYKSRGARIDDIDAVSKGQVYQRQYQTGYNDVGWEIAEGNYERFLNQIDPDETSIGLFRIRGEIDGASSKFDRFARSFEASTGKNTMYFKFNDEMFLNAEPQSITFAVTWLDKNEGSTWAFKYRSGNQAKTAKVVKGIGDNQWKTEVVTIFEMDLNHSGTRGSDFILVNTDRIDDVFHGIEADINR